GGAAGGVVARAGWLAVLESGPRAAVDVVFSERGLAHAAARVLDDVLASALGKTRDAGLAVLLPPFATWDIPGRIEAGRAHARGLATARAATARELLVVCRRGEESCAAAVSIATAAVGARDGVASEAASPPVRVQGR